ncbi:lipopolysaccharide biosynthesis protein [Flavobacterium gyeonganense]|uniref:lipopolysaccharide biosynthesis protein n=1 Tax=Flavobacterium gyeonganense TaxID=1310418 RepID=UPI002414571F|nr:lipopolysaccharide biosynthesis protein [Flavobacterium gyeonganense]
MIWGVFYTAISKYSSILISIGIGAILSRLLSPTEFGIVAIVIIFITFFNMLSDFGFGPAIIQNQNLNDKDIKSLFSLSLIFGSVFALLFFLLAPMIADFYSNQQLINISRLLSICVLFYSFSIVPKALCTKKLLFKKIAVISLLIQLFSGGMAVFFALNGYSYYSLIYKSILDAFLSFLSFFILVPIKVTFNIKLSSLKKILKFSVYQFMFNFINYFSRNADNLLIGRYFGASPLGYYNKSYQLMLMPVQNLTHVITPVLFPVLSEFQNDKSKIFSSYCRVVQLLAIIGFPLSVFLFFQHQI